MIDLIPSFGGFAFTILAFIAAILVIVAVHEFGHYIVGRWSGIQADVFSLGFGPVLVSRVDKRGTRWQIAALPFGGYVRFAGYTNAASAPGGAIPAGLSAAEKRRTLIGAPLWARVLTVAAGPVFNFIFSGLIFAGFMYQSGVVDDVFRVDQVHPTPVENGLVQGDIVLGVEGFGFDDLAGFSAVMDDLPSAAELSYRVERDGAEMEVRAPHPLSTLVLGLTPNSAAIDAGMQSGDVILALDDVPMATFMDLRAYTDQNDGSPIRLTYWRPDVPGLTDSVASAPKGRVLETTITPKRRDMPLPDGDFETRWLIGLSGGYVFTPATKTPSFGTALAYGADQTWAIVRGSLSAIQHMVAGQISTCNLSGPIGIAEVAGDVAARGALDFLWFLAALSTAIGMMNLFPIPILDGGHLVFYAYEAVAGRPPSPRFLEYFMAAGLLIVMSLMLAGLAADLFCA